MSFQMNNQKFSAIERMDDGVRAYFGRIYNYMAGGLAVSGAVAWAVAKTPLIQAFYTVTPTSVGFSLLGWIAVISPLILIFMIGSSLRRLNVGRAQGLFWLYSALMGVSLSNIFMIYADADIFQAFLVTAGMFAGMSLYGYTTQKSLASWGSFLIMGLFGVIIASVVNMFLKSGGVNFGLSVLSVVIFVGLTAYDTQKLKVAYDVVQTEDEKKAVAISGALSLYLDFINMFRLMLYFLNDRK